MTPFMAQVAEVAGGRHTDWPAVRPSQPRPVVAGADDQVMTRALAEQLVSEANAVLTAGGEVIELQDELAAGQLSFVLRYRSRHARVATSFGGGSSVGYLRGVGASAPGDGPGGWPGDVTLDCPGQVERLILLLIAGPSGPAGH